MKLELTPQQCQNQAAFRTFVEANISPQANEYDKAERVTNEIIELIARQGYLGAILPEQWGGSGYDMITLGLLSEEFGKGCSSLRSLLTVHGMVCRAILKWGSKGLRERWLPPLATGQTIAAFALTEPEAGSDAASIQTTATLSGEKYILNGHKKWITFGQRAGLFLVFAHCEGKPTAFLVERGTPGLTIRPVSGLLGLRASMTAELEFNNCPIPLENLVGRVGFGLSHIASYALDYGRYSVAWGCVGIGQACLEASLSYSAERRQFGVALKEHQLIRQMLTDMLAGVQASRLLCLQAGYLHDTGKVEAMMQTSLAKYFASTMAVRAANDTVQIHGANGCGPDFPAQRYLRDAKIMEIIEGSTQIQQITLADYAYQQYFSRSNNLC